MSISLDSYPEIKDELANIFSTKVSLADLGRRLERDLIIYEFERNKFKLSFKEEIFEQIKFGLQNSLDSVCETDSAEGLDSNAAISPNARSKNVISPSGSLTRKGSLPGL